MTPAQRRIAHGLFHLALLVYLATADGTLTTTDAVVTFELTRSIVEEGTFALPGNLLGMDAHRGIDDRYYSPFGLIPSLFNIPFFLIGRTIVDWGLQLGRPDTLPKAAVALSQTLVVAFLTTQVFRLALMVASTRAAVMAAVTCAFGSVLWPYALFGFNQPLAAVMLTGALIAALRGVRESSNRGLYAAGGWLGLGLLTRHELALAGAPIGAWILMASDGTIGDRVRRVLRMSAGLGAGLVVWLTYNYVRFGNPIDSGFLRDPVPGFGSSMTAGLAGLLFSPGASIFLYSPFALAGAAGLIVLFRRDRRAAFLLTAVTLTMTLFYATLGNWIGGRSYGSRYLLIVIPLLGAGWAAMLDTWPGVRRRRAFLAVLVIGVLVQLPGVLIDYSQVSQRAGARTTYERQWSWSKSPLVLNTHAVAEALPANMAYVAGIRPRPHVARTVGVDEGGFWERFDFSLDLWWLYLFYLDVAPRAMSLGIGLAFAAAIVLNARRLVRLTAAAPPD